MSVLPDGPSVAWLEACERKFGGLGLKQQASSLLSAKVSGIKPINDLLQEKPIRGPVIKPRRYQEELYLKALDQNVIIYLGTGLGKTFIAVLFLNSPMIDSQINLGRKVAFLAPTQDLIKQQAEYVYTKVPYKVRVYCGQTAHLGLHIDKWQESTWKSELQMIDLLFMTPQIFSSAISTGVLKWEQFSAVIFDEVHHASTSRNEKNGKNSGAPYSQALKHFNTFCKPDQFAVKPRFLGLTASLINNLPKNLESIKEGIHDLEHKLSARCITDISAIKSRPNISIHKYCQPKLTPANDKLVETLEESSKLFSSALDVAKQRKISLLGPKDRDEEEVVNYINRLRLAAHGFSIKPGSFHKILRQLISIRVNTGLWTFANVCFNLYQALQRHINSPFLEPTIKPMYEEFAAMLRCYVEMVDKFLDSTPHGYLLSYSQPKLLCLLDLLKEEHTRVLSKTSEKTQFSCIVFVKSRVEVFCVCGWLKMVSSSLPEYNFIKADYAIGLAATQTSKWACITKRKSSEQHFMLKNFREGHLNIIVTTSVLEEGIDLPVCSTVIRYDPAETFRIYVQSRGRARQEASTYIAMCQEPLLIETKDKLIKFNDLEYRIEDILSKDNTECLRSKDHYASQGVKESGRYHQDDVFLVEEKGIRIDSSLAKIILNMYFSRLSKLTPYSDGFTYEREETPDKYYITSVFFPTGSCITEPIRGEPKITINLADSSAIVAAYRALYMSGELDDHGIPIRLTEEHIDEKLEKYNMKPDFSPLSSEMEGHVEKIGLVQIHTFRWLLFDMRTCLAQAFTQRIYKLYRIHFIALDDNSVRGDTRGFIEKKSIGIIVDSRRSHLSWPDKLFGHYGVFRVEYELIQANLRLETYNKHRNYSSYTHRFVTAHWNLGRIHKEDFRERCIFYLVPLDGQNQIDESMIDQAFFTSREATSLRPNDLVRFASYYHQSQEDSTKSYLVKSIHHEMNIRSKIPDSRHFETFLDRALARYGNNLYLHPDKPIVEVIPIAQEIARSTEGKKIQIDYTTKSIFIPEQFLECYVGDIPTLLQAYYLPEIIYMIYLTTLASELESKFYQLTDLDRRVIIQPMNITECDKPWVTSDEDSEKEDEEYSLDEAMTPDDALNCDMNDESEESINSGDEIEKSEQYQYFSSSDESQDDDCGQDECEPKPKEVYRDILSRQKLNFRDSHSSLEKWDMGEYKVSELKPLDIQTKTFESSQKYLNTNPRMPYDGDWLNPAMNSAMRIKQLLENFRTGVIGSAYLPDNLEVLERPGKVVNMEVKPPITFDRPDLIKDTPDEMHFVTALTQKRSGERINLEGLENIGDSFLKYCSSVMLYQRIDANEGELTLARSRLVSNNHFAHLAKKNMLGYYAIGRKFDIEIIGAAFGGPEVKCHNRMRSKDLADIFESIVGTCLINRGPYEAILAIKWLGLQIFDDDAFSEFHKDAVVFAKLESTPLKDEPKSRELIKQSKIRVQRFQKIISYEFTNKLLLVQAFTHASSPLRCTGSYERLEFLGDAILDFLITMTIYKCGRITDPGQITSSRSALVNNYTFARLAIEYKFDIFIQHANESLYEELNSVNELSKSDPRMEFLNDFRFDNIAKILGDIFESVAGAIYIDSGCSLDAVYSIYYPMMKDLIEAEFDNPTKNLVRLLYEKFPGKDRIKIEFIKSSIGQKEGDETLTTHAILTIYRWGQFHGTGISKMQAKKRAVAEAIANLPTDEVQSQLDEEYLLVLKERNIHSVGRSRRPSSRNRGVGFRGGRGRGGRLRQGNYMDRPNHQPFPQREQNGNRRYHRRR